MPFDRFRLEPLACVLGSLFLFHLSAAAAEETTPPPAVAETIQVTATRFPEDVETVPSAITVISGRELAARGVTDLAGALALVSGVTVAPGGDGGPAGSVPEIWGLKEFDAFLLVVDGVPWGGAFNPALSSLDLNGVERIEVLRGAAPVMYGATSFVGVIHVIHRAAGAGDGTYSLAGGAYGSGRADAALDLPSTGNYRQSVNASAERAGFKDDRTGFERGQLLYRGELDATGGKWHLDFAGTVLKQDPASPHPRTGRVLTALVPLDANHNPRDAKIDENRLQIAGGFDSALAGGELGTTLAFTHSERDTIRGFLLDVTNSLPNARGFEQDLTVDDVYFDAHWGRTLSDQLRLLVGVDHLFGKGKQESEIFDYGVGLDGRGAPSSGGLTRREENELEAERNFSGIYLQAEWTPVERLSFELGLRLNHTREKREGEAEPIGEEEPGAEEEGGEDSRSNTRGGAFLGVNFRAWQQDDNALWLFADYRNTYKPAAIDFGPEAEGEILDPETATSYEAGLKGRNAGGKLDWQVSVFQMDFENLVVSQIINGLPGLINAGTERFRGAELEAGLDLPHDLRAEVAYSHHDAKFNRFTRLFDGVPFVLDGNRLELSAKDLASAALIFAPERGFLGSVEASYVGDRYLNQRNTALAKAYTLWGASVGYRFAAGELRLSGTNLGDERPPIAESELGDAQYYRQPARSIRLMWRGTF